MYDCLYSSKEINVFFTPGDSEENGWQCELLQTMGAVQERIWELEWRILAG